MNYNLSSNFRAWLGLWVSKEVVRTLTFHPQSLCSKIILYWYGGKVVQFAMVSRSDLLVSVFSCVLSTSQRGPGLVFWRLGDRSSLLTSWLSSLPRDKTLCWCKVWYQAFWKNFKIITTSILIGNFVCRRLCFKPSICQLSFISNLFRDIFWITYFVMYWA